jgi:hypothetical protein
MKLIGLSIITLLLLYGCNEDNVSNEQVPQLENRFIVKFQLLDSTNVSKTVFNKSEKVFFDLYLRNELYQDLSYSYTGYPFIYEIIHDDTLFATSLDYVAIELMEYTEILKSGTEKHDWWLAPNSFGRILEDKELTFSPGIYDVRIRKQSRSGYLNEIPIEINPITFEIIE